MLTLCLVKLSESKSFENRVPIMSVFSAAKWPL